MSRNGSGTYSAPSGSWNPATNGNSATAADWNTLLADIASALTQSVSADGQTPITGNLNMGNNKLTSLAAGSASGQSVAWQQLFSQGTESDIASSSTVDIGAQNTNFLRVTGTTTITSFGTNYNGPRFLRFAGALTLTHNGSTLILPTGSNITTAAGDCCIALPISGGWYVAAYQRTNGQALSVLTPFLRNYHQGFNLSTAGSSTTITVGQGQCADSTNAVLIDLAASINKTTSAWAVGTGNGGLDTGSIANSTWYHFYAIRRPDTGVVDVLFSVSATAPTMPANYTQRRWIGCWKTNASAQWEDLIQYDDSFIWKTAKTNFNSSTGTTANRISVTLADVPLGIKVIADLQPSQGNLGGDRYISDLSTSDEAASIVTGFAQSSGGDKYSSRVQVRTNTSQQVGVRSGNSTAVFQIVVYGFNIAEAKGRN